MSDTPFVPSTEVEKHFAWLSTFPHGSKNEKPLSDAIREKAEHAGLETYQDEHYNLLVRKPAAPGCEDKAPVILQAHLDMVCARIPGCKHNFETDPLTLLVDADGWLHADGTTLGADDGYGMAYMLALLFSDVRAPELECLFTAQEEVGLIGAASLDLGQIRSRRMISMDCGCEHVVVVSSCGGCRITFTLPLERAAGEGRAFRIAVGGLAGGHSAGVIHLSHANAIKLLAHTLCALEPLGVSLVHIESGEADNAVPRDGSALIRIPEKNVAAARTLFEQLRSRFMKAHAASDPDMTIRMEEAPAAEGPAYGMKLARLLTALPDGIRAMEPARPEIVALSSNLGVLKLVDGEASVTCMIRSANDEWRALLFEQATAVGDAFGARAEIDSQYPGMEYNPESALRRQFAELIRAELGREVEESSTHGGLEIGYFSRSIDGLDILTLGCVGSGGHSPAERLCLSSFNRMYEILVKLIEALP